VMAILLTFALQEVQPQVGLGLFTQTRLSLDRRI
jgi:hypothetical protein